MELKKQCKDENNTVTKLLEEEVSKSSPENTNFSQFESQFNFSPLTENLLKSDVPEQALENIKNIFNKTQTIRKVADEKHQKIEMQFKELRERLNNSSECLQRMKKGIDNIKFSYQTKILEIQKNLTPPCDYYDKEKRPPQVKEDMAKQMEAIKNQIEEIQSQVYTKKEKHERVMQSYTEAFENVSAVLESIDKGEYTSITLPNNN